MSEQVLQRGNAMERSRTRTIAQVAMLGAVAGVLMNLYAYNSDLSCPEFVLEGNYYLYDFAWAE